MAKGSIGALDPKMYLSVATKPSADAVAEVVSMEVEEAKQNLISAAQGVTAVERAGSIPYGRLVQATANAMEAGLSRQMIAQIIVPHLESATKTRVVKSAAGEMSETEISKGSAARYIMLARAQRGEWLEGETPVTSVTIADQVFTKPVEALMAGVASFSRVWRAFRDAVKPPVQDLTKIPSDPVEAIELSVAKMGFRVKTVEQGKEVLTTVPITNPLGFVAVMHGLLKLDIARKLLPKTQAANLLKVLDEAVDLIPAQAKTLTVLKGGKAA